MRLYTANMYIICSCVGLYIYVRERCDVCVRASERCVLAVRKLCCFGQTLNTPIRRRWNFRGQTAASFPFLYTYMYIYIHRLWLFVVFANHLCQSLARRTLYCLSFCGIYIPILFVAYCIYEKKIAVYMMVIDSYCFIFVGRK